MEPIPMGSLPGSKCKFIGGPFDGSFANVDDRIDGFNVPEVITDPPTPGAKMIHYRRPRPGVNEFHVVSEGGVPAARISEALPAFGGISMSARGIDEIDEVLEKANRHVEEAPTMAKSLGRKEGGILPWWFAWPFGRCINCGRWFMRHWPWSCGEEVCSKGCNDETLDRDLGPPNAGGKWEVKTDDDGEMVRIRWSRPFSDGTYFWVRHYPNEPWGVNACERQAAEWNKDHRQPWQFNGWRSEWSSDDAKPQS